MLAIRAARLFDGHQLRAETVALLDGERIAAVLAQPPPGVPLLDLGGATLVPGLVDAHVHLVLDGSPDPIARLSALGDDELLAAARSATRTTLAAGITTVRDLGDRGYLAVRLRAELIGGPRLLASGPPITVPGGHCWFLGGEHPAGDPDGLRAAVRERAERGVDVVKVMASGGNLTPGSRAWCAQYTRDELRVLVDEAHRYGLPVAAHAHAGRAVADAVAAGCDSIEHCSFITAAGVDPRPEVIDAIVAAGTAVSYTCGMVAGAGPPLPAIAARLDGLRAALLRLRAAGMPLACSSDAGITPPKPHGLLPYSAATFVAAGFAPVEALRAVTSVPARLSGLGTVAGRIAPGYAADLLAVDGDPLRDIDALRAVAAVFYAGRRVA